MSETLRYKDKIMELLRGNTRGLTDNQISKSLGGTQQQTNIACRELERSGLIVRQRKGTPPRIHNISLAVLREGGDNEPAEWKRKLEAMVRVNGGTEEEMIDAILSDFGELILQETPAHEMIVSLIRSKEGRTDHEILNDALQEYLNGRDIEYEPWEMKAQIIAEKRRETQEEVLEAAVTEQIAGQYERAMRDGGEELIQMMRNINSPLRQREQAPRETRPAPTKVDLRDRSTEAVEPAQGYATLQTDAVVAEEDEPGDSPDPSTFQGREAAHGRDAAEEGTFGV